MPQEQVLVIGAGPAGIASAYALEQAGIPYRVVDRADVIASTWAGLYPSLRLNTSRFYSHMTGARFPLHYGIFPTGRQYHRYLLDYANRHRFNIQLGVTVQRVAPEGELWRVESSQGTALYPVVISATGVFGGPVWPDIPGMDSFRGLLLHACDFTGPQMVADRRLLVVGSGPSGVDIAIAAAESAQRPVFMSIRSGIDLRPRYPWGLPRHAWMMIGELLPRPLCEWLQRKVGALRYANQEDYGLKRPAEGESSTAVPYRGPELIHAVRDGLVRPVAAPLRFDADGVFLADGTYEQVDAAVLCTGYRPVLHQYLDIPMQYSDTAGEPESPCDWELGPNGVRGWPLRDTSSHPNGRQVLGYPGLYLVGTFYKGKGAMYNFNVEARIAAEQIGQYLAQRRERV